ncbi:hypothetical protein [Streptomyces sp. cg35]|uniref:hypothetical protein n=1 Tax=Streptomyces sp. cg35 TaxID=3421650 RepID=UPI003D17D3C3
MTAPTAAAGPPDLAPGAGPAELLDHAEQLLELHDAQDRPEEAGVSWRSSRDALLRADGLLVGQGGAVDPAELARCRFLLGLTLSVGYWQAVGGNADAYEVHDPPQTRETAIPLLAEARATLHPDDPEYATACVRVGLLLHSRYEDARAAEDDAATEPSPPADRVTGPDASDLVEALAAFDDGVPRLDEEPHPGLIVAYGCALADRYDLDADPEDMRRARAALESVLDGLRPVGWVPAEDGAGSWADEADDLETEARVRLIRLLDPAADTADGASAVAHLELLAATLPHEHHARIFAAAHLVDVYRERGDGRVSPADRPAYLASLRDLSRLVDPQSPYRAQATAMLGAALAERDESAGPGSLPTPENEQAVGLLREALDDLAEDDGLRPTSHALLGCLLNSLREHHPARYDNDEALHHLERAVELIPADDPMRSDLLNQLAHARIVRSDQGHVDLEGVDRTIALLNESMRVPSQTPGFGSQSHGAYAAALSQRHALSHSSDDLDEAIRHLTAAYRQTAVDDVNRIVYLQNLSISLYQRYQEGGDLQDLQTAARYIQEVNAVVAGGDRAGFADLHLVGQDLPYLEHGLVQMQFMLASASRSRSGMAAAVEAMRRLQTSVPEDDPGRLELDADLGLMLLLYSFFGGTPRDRVDGLALMAESVEAMPGQHPQRPRLLLRTSAALLMTSFAPYNKRGVEAAEKLVRETLAAVEPDSPEGLRATTLHAVLCHARFAHGRAPADADRAVELARAARERIADRPPSPLATLLAQVLSDVLRARSGPGDDEAARRTGVAGLREAATVVLLQASAEPALQMARTASERALTIARWCLADGDLPGAVEALELGRGQVLHASTTTSDVPACCGRRAGRIWPRSGRAAAGHRRRTTWGACWPGPARCWAPSTRGPSCRSRTTCGSGRSPRSPSRG